MCIIAAKPAGVPMPDEEILRAMWNSNRDGAGFMYAERGKVRIEKGFMKYQAFADALEKVRSRLDLTATPVVLHFRITTHGGTKPENTHPFPITDNMGALRKLTATTDVGVAHNGIIPITARRGVSDTMTYIASQLAPLKRALPRFYENKHAMQLIENAIESRMAFLTGAGKIYTIGHFIEDGGVLYSNSSYKELRAVWRSCDYGSGWGKSGDWYAYAGAHDTGLPWDEEPEVLMLMWLDDSDVVRFPDGDLDEGCDYLIDEDLHVWHYDWQEDGAEPVEGAVALTSSGAPVRYDEALAVETIALL